MLLASVSAALILVASSSMAAEKNIEQEGAWLKFQSCQALAKAGNPRGLQDLVDLICHDDKCELYSREMTDVVNTLASYGPSATPVLEKAVRSIPTKKDSVPNLELLTCAPKVVKATKDPEAIRLLTYMIDKFRFNDVCSDSISALSNIGIPAIPALLKLTSGSREAVSALIAIGKPAIGPLTLSLSDRDEGVRFAASKTLAFMGEPDALEALIKDTSKITAIKDSNGTTMLMVAAQSGNINLIRALISSGAKLNERDRRGQTALMAAVCAKNLPAVQCLAESGADLNLPAKVEIARNDTVTQSFDVGSSINGKALPPGYRAVLTRKVPSIELELVWRTPLKWATLIKAPQIADYLRNKGAK